MSAHPLNDHPRLVEWTERRAELREAERQAQATATRLTDEHARAMEAWQAIRREATLAGREVPEPPPPPSTMPDLSLFAEEKLRAREDRQRILRAIAAEVEHACAQAEAELIKRRAKLAREAAALSSDWNVLLASVREVRSAADAAGRHVSPSRSERTHGNVTPASLLDGSPADSLLALTPLPPPRRPAPEPRRSVDPVNPPRTLSRTVREV